MRVAIKIYDKISVQADPILKKQVDKEIRALSLLSNTMVNEEKIASIAESPFKSTEYSDNSMCFGDGHPNIMKMYDSIETLSNICLITEKANGKIL